MNSSCLFKRFCLVCLVSAGLILSYSPVLSEEPGTLPDRAGGFDMVTIVMESYSFTPQSLTGDIGEPLEFLLKNESFLVPHNFLLDSPSGVRLIEVNVESGEESRVRFTPTESGTYLFYCDQQLLFFPTHQEEGMQGTLTVR